jgi:LAS superfamily LD-carboxypeptidase LdcB/peptidoglycan/xylan/chitin deacetylase (PgdA/CDA1 family)
MGKHFGLLAFTTIIAGGSIGIFAFADLLIITFAPGSTHAKTIENESIQSVLVVEENQEELNIVDNALLELYKNAVVINKFQEVEVAEDAPLSQKELGVINRSLSLPVLSQPEWFPENIFITIDDGPRIGNGSLQNILETLDKHGVKAYFFFVGDVIKEGMENWPENTKRELSSLVSNGHKIGWHSMHHTHFSTKKRKRLDIEGSSAVISDIQEFKKLLDETLGFSYKLETSRMPGGSGTYKADIIKAVESQNLRAPTFWHIETQDWENQVSVNLSSYVSNILRKKSDYIVLLHEYSRTGEDLDKFLEEIKRQTAPTINPDAAVTKINASACPGRTMISDLDKEPLSKTHSLPESYAPSELVSIAGDWGTYCIKSEVHDALTLMMDDAAKEGLDIEIYSGYRSYSLQSRLFKNWNKRNPDGAIYPAVAEPGHSEHQLGTTVDLKSGALPYGESNPFGDSPEYPWMKENAHKYGFVQSYQSGKQAITGYIAEPWHWRYLGIEMATEIKKSGLTINEYLEL